MKNYKNFIDQLVVHLEVLGIKQRSGQQFTATYILEITLNYIRNNDDFRDKLAEAIPIDYTKDISQQFKYFNLFIEGSNIAFLVMIAEDISFGNYIVIQALANVLGIDIKLSNWDESLILSSSISDMAINVSFADNPLSIVHPDLLHSLYLTSSIYHINDLESLKNHLIKIRGILHPSLIESNKLDSIIVSELYSIKALKDLDTQVSGYIIEEVAGDGNCFFHVIALQLRASGIIDQGGSEYTHLRLRENAVNYINHHQEDYRPLLAGIADDIIPNGNFSDSTEVIIRRLQLHQDLLHGNIDAYVAEMRQNHVWVDHLIIQALANTHNLTIYIHHVNGHIENITPNDNHHQAAPIVVHTLYTGTHYALMIRASSATISSPIDIIAATQLDNSADASPVFSEDSLNWESVFTREEESLSMYFSGSGSGSGSGSNFF